MGFGRNGNDRECPRSPDLDRALVGDIAMDIDKSTVEHIECMYPAALEAVPTTARISTRADEAAERRRTERRAKCSKERVTRMEEAFHWVLAHVGKPEHRKVLLAYAEVKARGWQWDRYLQNRNRRNPTENAWVKRTVQRWIVLSLQEISDNIPKRDILLPADRDLLLAQIEGESPCKSIRSDLRSWMSPDGKPSYRRTM